MIKARSPFLATLIAILNVLESSRPFFPSCFETLCRLLAIIMTLLHYRKLMLCPPSLLYFGICYLVSFLVPLSQPFLVSSGDLSSMKGILLALICE